MKSIVTSGNGANGQFVCNNSVMALHQAVNDLMHHAISTDTNDSVVKTNVEILCNFLCVVTVGGIYPGYDCMLNTEFGIH